MKKNYTVFYLSVLLITSCSKTLYTHQEVLNSYKTKSDVVARFGIPSEVKTGDDKTTLYYYNLNELKKIHHVRLQLGDPLSKNNKRAYINVSKNSFAIYDSTKSNIDMYLKVSFSEDYKVIGNEVRGVGFSVKAPSAVKTVALVFLLPPLIGAALFSLSGFGWK